MKTIIVFSLILFSQLLFSSEKNNFICGIANGFPPYQYVENSKSAGIDVEVAKMVFEKAKLDFSFLQENWEDLLFNLIHNVKKLDMLCGAEITLERQKYLEFTQPYYKRKIVLFTLKNNRPKNIDELFDKVIAGDLHSSFETALGEKKKNIRITKTESKEDSFLKLKEKKVYAVIAPLEVGLYLSKKLKIEIEVFDEGSIGTPVAIAVKKDNKELLLKLNNAIKVLIDNGKIDKVLKKYQMK